MTKNTLLFLIPVLFLIGLSNISQAQSLEHKLGQFLIKTEYPIEKVLQPYQSFDGKRTQLKLNKKIAPAFDIYLVEFDHGEIHEEKFLNTLKKSNLIDEIQYNHIVNLRATPNDPQFANQWQYINTGQSGGTPGADIDMDLAWDITTGGLTALGDTIVVAVIDEGFDFGHSDFGDNLWINHDEIPDNGIDDDNNGYTDDYQGWNAYNQTDNITGGWHGTPVSGIIGAQGNNALGVAGVNWDVKIMIIQGGGDEADALAAYAYCYTERQLYNNTGGVKGSFVVSTNASWGTDLGQPADAPLWCGFYDTLGEEGIINCGATANANYNIDTQGDLPTGCSSDFLISVTNMNDDDIKVNGAGYGLTTIDLGAFGAGTWTVTSGDSYGGFGGTSGATPHVAGTAALMYSSPCPSFAALAKSDPAAAALLTKQYILDGVDPNTSLSGITVTGGRLNAHNALAAIINNCDPNGCFTPYSLQIDNLLDTSLDIIWSVGEQTDQSNLRYREIGAATWNVLTNVSSPYTLTGVAACTEYEFQVQALCGADQTEWSNSLDFQTDGCCEPPSSININGVTDSEANISWSSVLAAISYDMEYKEASGTTWMTSNVTGTSMILANLEICTEYEVRIRTICTGENADYSNTFMFKTSGCGACLDNTYCQSNSVNSEFEWIDSVVLNTLDNPSGNDNGYGNYTDMGTDLEIGTTYDLSLKPGYSESPYAEFFNVWIDYNQDGDFEDADELVFSTPDGTMATVTSPITIPVNALIGNTRMRISMKWNSPADYCTEDFDYGEVEDYCLNIIDNPTTSCSIPTGIAISNIMETSVNLNWNTATDAIGYEIRYREVGTGTWLSENVTSPDIVLTNLLACKEYEYQIRTTCSSEVSEYSFSTTFTTFCEACDIPANISVLSTNETSISLDWDDMTNAVSYEVQYRELGTTPWNMETTTSSDFVINGLSECKEHEYGIRTICNTNESSYSQNMTAMTACVSSIGIVQDLLFNIHPNPVSESLTIEFNNNFSSLDLQLMDISGKIISRFKASGDRYSIDMSNHSTGVYLLQVRSDTKMGTRKIIKL